MSTSREPSGKKESRAIAGILNIDKPAGITSHDVVARVRRHTGIRRVGHAGTLDPMATGVLLVCLGSATRIVEYLSSSKTYLATVRLGVVTDTWDAEGRVVATNPLDSLSADDIRDALTSFEGTIEQVPPMFSALKHHGQPLYRLARQGIFLARAARTVDIQHLRLAEWRPPEVVLYIDCSRGTYVRSLAHDLGEKLGVGGHLSALVRLRVGQFRLAEAVRLDTLLDGDAHMWRRYLIRPREALAEMPHVVVAPDVARRLSHGQSVALSNTCSDDGPCCAYDDQGELVAIIEREDSGELWKPHKVFNAS